MIINKHCFPVISDVLKSVSEFSHRLADVIVFGFATSHAAPIEEGDGKYCRITRLVFTSEDDAFPGGVCSRRVE